MVQLQDVSMLCQLSVAGMLSWLWTRFYLWLGRTFVLVNPPLKTCLHMARSCLQAQVLSNIFTDWCEMPKRLKRKWSYATSSLACHILKYFPCILPCGYMWRWMIRHQGLWLPTVAMLLLSPALGEGSERETGLEWLHSNRGDARLADGQVVMRLKSLVLCSRQVLRCFVD